MGQIEAISLGLSRALEKTDSSLRSALEKEDF
jgi:ribosomal protein S9